MGHPIFVNPPSTDMTAAQERQRELDAQIEVFLAKGGKIQAFDQLRRPVDLTWSDFTINPHKCQTKSVPAANVEEAQPAAKPLRQYRARPDDERIAVKIILEAALGGTPVDIARSLRIPLSRCLAIAEQCPVQFHG